MIPEGFIEDANRYSILPDRETKPIYIGGRFMMQLVVRDQMSQDMIIATTGTMGNACMIIVAYKRDDVLEFIDKARQKVARLKKVN